MHKSIMLYFFVHVVSSVLDPMVSVSLTVSKPCFKLIMIINCVETVFQFDRRQSDSDPDSSQPLDSIG
eukprot:m.47944 g.47944  ORF g.47944 m.47944 type:complete len:68 (-) comp20624_c1_seq2:665-868(-)